MAYTITDLDSRLKDYLKVNKDELISKAIFNSKVSDGFGLQTGVKSDTAIVVMDTNVVFQDGKTCGFNASGDTTFSDRILTPAYIKVNQSFCPKTWLDTYKSQDIMVQAGRESMPFEEKIANRIVEKTAAEVEKLLWLGDKTNGTGNMALLDGIYTLILGDIAGTDPVIPTANVIAKSSDDMLTRVMKTWKKIPAENINDAVIYTSIANFNAFIEALVDENHFHLFEKLEDGYELNLPWAPKTKLIGVEGLGTTDALIAMRPTNIVMGVDLENDREEYKIWYSDDDDLFKLKLEFAVAVNYIFPEEIIVNK